MPKIEVEDIIGPAAISLLSSWQMLSFAKRVGKARSKYKVPPPETTGDPNFVRVFRAQQNSVEWYPVFLSGLWTGSLLLHQVPCSALGIIYIIGRQKYFNGYSEAAEKRMGGFKISAYSVVGLIGCGVLGLLHAEFVYVTGKTVFEYFK